MQYEDTRLDPEEQLNIRIAWYYHIVEMTQQQIADRFGITRVRVNKALATCRQSGVVQIRINSKLASCVRLEHELEQHYGLAEVIVVPTPLKKEFIFNVIAVGASPYLHDQLFEGCSFGVGWGRTLRHTIRETRGRNLPSMTVVSLMGALNSGSGYNTIEITSSFARLFSTRHYYYLAAPVYADSEEMRDMILAQEGIREVYEKARNVDVALVTGGDLTDYSTMLELRLISHAEAESLKAAGAVGDLLGHYLNKDGERIDHPLNRRVVSLSLEDLGRIRKVILAAGGLYKADVIRAILRRRLAHVLVTDEATARQLMIDPPSPA